MLRVIKFVIISILSLSINFTVKAEYLTKEAVSFFKEKGIELRVELNQLGLPKGHSIRLGLKKLKKHWDDESKIKVITSGGKFNAIQYLGDGTYGLRVADKHIDAKELIAESLLRESYLRILFEKEIIQENLWVSVSDLQALQKFFENKSFAFQGGMVDFVSKKGLMDYECNDPSLLGKGNYATLLLGYFDSSRYDVTLLAKLASGELAFMLSKVNAFDEITINSTNGEVYNEQLKKLIEFTQYLSKSGATSIAKINLVPSDEELTSVSVSNRSSEADNVRLELNLSARGLEHTLYGFSAELLYTRRASEVISFFRKKNVRYPDRMTSAVIRSLEIIKKNWSPRLKIREIRTFKDLRYHSCIELVEDETGPYNVIFLNREKSYEDFLNHVVDAYIE